MSPGLRLCILAVFATAAPRVARAQAPTDGASCLAAFESAQVHRKSGELLAADRDLVTCGQAQCPAVVRSKCIEWREEVQQILPSIVVTVTGVDGDDTSNARVLVDDVVVREKLDGRPIQLDPGSHRLQVEHGAEPPRSQEIVLSEGQQNRAIAVSFAPDTPLAADQAGLSPLVFVGAGVAGLGIIVGAITGGLALSKGSELNDVCPDKTRCAESGRGAYDDGLVLSHVSTVGFVVAGAGAALAVVGLVLSDWSGEDVELAVGPLGAVLRGRF